jgi:hypothetical protein
MDWENVAQDQLWAFVNTVMNFGSIKFWDVLG